MVFVYRILPLVSKLYACLTIIARCVPRESRTENCFWPIFTCVSKTFDTHKRKSTSIACCALAPHCLFRVTFPSIPWTYLGDLKRIFSRGRQRVAPRGTTQPYLEISNEFQTRHYLCTLYYWTIMFTFFKRKLSVQFGLHTPMMGWQ